MTKSSNMLLKWVIEDSIDNPGTEILESRKNFPRINIPRFEI